MPNVLALPEIDAPAPVPSAASAYDRLGSELKQAGNETAGAVFDMEMATVAVQKQEAALQTTRGLNDTLQFIRSNPYLSPQQVKDAFGGKPPESIPLTEQVVGPDGKLAAQDRKVIPMHEVAADLFDARSAQVVENATSGVSGEGWKDKYRREAAQAVEAARSEALDWQRAQRLADAHIRTVSQYQQAVAARQWDLAKLILDTPENQLDSQTRETLRAEMPKAKTEAYIEDRLRMGSREDLLKLQADITANRVKDPTKKPIIENADGTFSTERTISFEQDGKNIVVPTIVNGEQYTPQQAIELYRQGKNPALGTFATQKEAEDFAQQRHLQQQKDREGDRGAFDAPLSAEDQFKFSHMARERIQQIDTEAERQRKAAKEALFQNVGNYVEAALQKAQQTGEPATNYFSIADIPSQVASQMDIGDFLVLKNALAADPGRKTDNRYWTQLDAIDRSGGLVRMPVSELMAYRPHLSEDDYRTWADRWAKAKDPEKKQKPLFTDDEDKLINKVLTDHWHFKTDNAENRVRFENAKAQLQRNLLDWRSRNTDAPMLFDTILTESARTTFNANTANDNNWLGIGPDNQPEWFKKFLGDEGAKSTLNIAVRDANPGRQIGALDLRDHVEQMKKEAPVVEEAWHALGADVTPLEGTARAAVHGVLINKPALDRVDERLRQEGKEPTQRNRIFRIVEDMAPPQAEPVRRQREAEALDAAKRAQVEAAGKQLKAEADAKAAAERARWNALPDWEKGLTTLEKDTLAELDNAARRAQYEAESRQVKAGMTKAERMDQTPNWLIGRPGYSKVAPEEAARARLQPQLDEDAKARAARLAGRKEQLQETLAATRDAYRKHWETHFMGTDGKTELLFPKEGGQTFREFFKARNGVTLDTYIDQLMREN